MTVSVRRIIRADFNNLWRAPDADCRGGLAGVTVGERSNPGLAVGELVTVFDWSGDDPPPVSGTVVRIEHGKVFICCDWEN